MGYRSTTSVRRAFKRRWLRRAVVVAASGLALFYGLFALGASGGILLRNGQGCPRSVGSLTAISWLDLIHVRGARYEVVEPTSASDPRIRPNQVGEQLDTIRCAVGESVQRPGYDLRDGESTFLPPGTAIHALAGTDPDFRVVAMDDGAPTLYENRRTADATAGAELFPFAASEVEAVTFLSAVDARTVLGTITQPAQVRSFSQALWSSRIDTSGLDDLGEEPRVFVALELADQPPVILVVYVEQGVTTDGLVLSGQLLAQLPDPRP